MITGTSLSDILTRLNEASVAGGVTENFVPDTLEDLDIDGPSLVMFAEEVAVSLAVAGAEQNSGLIELVASGLVLGVQLGVYAERERANE